MRYCDACGSTKVKPGCDFCEHCELDLSGHGPLERTAAYQELWREALEEGVERSAGSKKVRPAAGELVPGEDEAMCEWARETRAEIDREIAETAAAEMAWRNDPVVLAENGYDVAPDGIVIWTPENDARAWS
jgi:hypothetical protein